MNHYEINDVRRRREEVPDLIDVELESFSKLTVENIGKVTAKDIKFEFTNNLKQAIGNSYDKLENGIKRLSSGKIRTYSLDELRGNLSLIDSNQINHDFKLTVSYSYPYIKERISEVFDFNDLIIDWIKTGVLKMRITSVGRRTFSQY